MEERNEKFLKDLAWSEAWFPWKKKNMILVRGREGNFWEPFAVVVSAVALLVSTAATIGTWRQVDVMTEQLTISDRNKALQTLTNDLMAYCQALSNPPLKPEWYLYRDVEGRLYEAPQINGNSIKGIEKEKENEYFRDLDIKKKQVHISAVLFSQVALSPSDVAILEGISTEVSATYSPSSRIYTDRNWLYRNIFSDALACMNSVIKTINTIKPNYGDLLPIMTPQQVTLFDQPTSSDEPSDDDSEPKQSE